jgi:N-acetylneuraminic acid mutarotase
MCQLNSTSILLWGGVNETLDSGSRYLDDYYRFDIGPQKEWKLIPTQGEPICGRAFHSAVMFQGIMYVFGGCNGRGRFNKLYTITEDGQCALVEPSGDLPSTRYCHSAVVYEHFMMVFGGKCGGRNSNRRLADLFSYDFRSNSWTATEQLGEIPPSRSAHAAFVCGRQMLVFGGRNGDGRCCDDLYEYSIDTKIWRQIATGHNLLGRARHSVVVHHGTVVVFGGWNGRKKLNDLFILQLDTHHTVVVHDSDENDPRLPCRRECHTAVVVNDSMIVFGGRFRGLFMNDVYELPLDAKPLKDYCRDWILAHTIDFRSAALPQHLVEYIQAGYALLQNPRLRRPMADDLPSGDED